MSREVEETRKAVACPVCFELFCDARLLTCSHSFCLQCLIGCQMQAGLDGVGEIGCPVCRELTVPALADIHLLPVNIFVNKVADIIRTHDNSLSGHIELAEHENIEDAHGEDAHSLIVGELLPEQINVHVDTSRSSWNTYICQSLALAVTILITSYYYFHSNSFISVSVAFAVATVVSLAALYLDRKVPTVSGTSAYVCDGCHKIQTSILRYKCGMCNDFTFCANCFAMDNLSQRHHIFLKVKCLQKRAVPLGPILKSQAFALAETFDYDSSVHGRAYIHHPDRLLRVTGIRCSFCGVMPIKGQRFKCGMCNNYDLCSVCEVNSHNIHDESHVFLVLKYKAEVNFMSEPLCRAYLY